MSRQWDPRYMDQYGRFVGSVSARLTEIDPQRAERVVEYAPKGYDGDRTHCLLCDAWLERYRDGYGNHWLDTTQGGKCKDGAEHQRSPDTSGET